MSTMSEMVHVDGRCYRYSGTGADRQYRREKLPPKVQRLMLNGGRPAEESIVVGSSTLSIVHPTPTS